MALENELGNMKDRRDCRVVEEMREAGVDQLLNQLGIAGEGAGACSAHHSLPRYAEKQKQRINVKRSEARFL